MNRSQSTQRAFIYVISTEVNVENVVERSIHDMKCEITKMEFELHRV